MDLVEELERVVLIPRDGLCEEAAAEIARLRARPTELEVANTIKDGFEKYSFATDIARAVLALFPKVQP